MKRSEHFHFYKQDQAADETITDFDVALRKLAVHCDHEFSDHLQETLRDHFVHGLHNEAIQHRLLSELTLTYVKAIEIVRGMEFAD